MTAAARSEALSLSAASDAWRPTTSPWLIAAAVMAATFMEVLDTTVVNVSLPHIAGNLSASTEEATWVLTSYLVSNAIILPMTGWLSARFGRKRYLIASIVIFTVASGLCGAAPTLPLLILARILQGIGGGALQPISQAILLESFPAKKRGVAMAVFGLGVVTAPIIGPTLGGWITENYSWRWIFYINIPVGFLAISMILAMIQDPPYLRNIKRRAVDYLGFALLVIWVASLQILLDKGQQVDWFSSKLIRVLAVSGTVCLLAFVWRELRIAQPIVNLRILANRNFCAGVILMGVMGAVLYASIALVPLFLQTLLGYSAVQSGMAVSPRGLGSLVGMLFVGRLIGIIDSRMLIAGGFVLLGYTTFQFSQFNLQIAPRNIIWPNIFNGLSTALIFVPLTTLTMATLHNDQIGGATGIYNLMRNLGGSIGIAMTTTMLARGSQAHQAAMITHLTPFDPVYRQQLQALAANLTAQSGSSALGMAQAQALLYKTILIQAQLWAYVDNFRLLALLCFLCVPFLIIFKAGRVRRPVLAH